MMKFFGIFVFFGLLFIPHSEARNQIARVSGEYPYVYASPDFNAPILAQLPLGKVYKISTKKFANVFYRILVKPGMIGYVSDSEIQVLTSGSKGKPRSGKAPRKNLSAEKKEEKKEPEKDNRKPFYASRYRGLIVEQMNYAEDTMSQHRTANLNFIGYRVSGYNTLYSGQMATDANVMLYNGAPKYYEEVTGNPANGWILHADFTYDTLSPQGPNHMISYGFGPMFKYSHFVTALQNPANGYTTSYTLDDITLGVLLRWGLAFRIDSVSLRSDIKYYIESQRYLAFNLSLLFEY
ncbi:MAG: SH3 domain-containing protein [Bdellovibrionales bacterium]|nr:SH3 domain-containing protein [Bdellovibrionales bacterium]